ncbi:hypothetical protein [Kordiimonas lacus]|uniref:HMW1C N-terminal domain-containing protein n=1 Tax=Kordiimonas lacus TaxID=637679 RepID=A0A1G7F8J1_9PROT|nr:hypothetical protein [Kordiimonas lacus]SDE71835.1 hypothetical protein SAMN04488071_3653 [Kordiimonas lacus]
MSKEAELKLIERIKRFDHNVRNKKFESANKSLEGILKILERGSEGFGGALVARGPLMEREATMLASAVTSLLADPDFKMTNLTFRLFTQFKRALMQVFEVSGYRGTDHLLDVIGTRDKDGKVSFKGYELPKLFAGLSINALTSQLVALLKRQKPEISWPLVIGYLSEQLLWSQKAEDARSEMLTWSDTWKNVPGSLQAIRNLGPAYMGCSYADARHKHQIKYAMNHMARSYLESRGVTDADLPAKRRAVKRRPTVIVMAELYDSRHAMHRCYGGAIRSLKRDFKTIYMSPSGECDEVIHDMFDKVDNTKFNANTPEIFINKMKSYRPDIVYYPSIGMRLVSILASNVRIAPIQVMTFGHPATTFSEHIDYSILVEGQLGAEDVVNETILYRPSAPRWHRRRDAEDIKPNIRKNPETVRIAVPAWSRKVTPRFLATCDEIAKRSKEAGRSVEFHFFPNGVGALYQAVARRVEEMLPAKVWPRTGYNQYINRLNQCDIFLSSFPFGATNGIIDAALQGLPVVNLRGDEVHARNDSDIVAKFEQPEWLSTDTVEDYVKAVVRLVTNDEERVEISEAIANFDHEVGLLVPDDDHSEEFATVMNAAYKNHEVIQRSSDHSWSFERLRASLTPAA